jgi:two-component system cell cycle sensor histidine kinase/response regulator CckA
MTTFYAPDEGFLDGKRPSIEDLRSELRALRRRCRELERKASAGAEPHYKALSESIPDVVFAIGLDGRVLYVNNSAADFIGMSADKIVGMRHSDLFPAEIARQQWLSIEEVLKTGEPRTEELSFAYPQGQRRQETRLFPIKDDSGQIGSVLGVCRDVTGVRNAQKALRQSESLFGAVFDSSSDSILLVDDSGRFVAANPAATQFLELQRDELLRITIWDIVPDGISSPMHSEWTTALQKGSGRWGVALRLLNGNNLQCRCYMRSGVVPGLNMLVLTPAAPVGECATAQVPAETAPFFDLLDGIDDGMCAYDNSLNIIAFNQAFAKNMEQAFGRYPVKGDSFKAFSPDEHAWSEWQRNLERPLLGEAFQMRLPLSIAGSDLTMEFRFKPLRTVEGEIAGAVVIGTPLTELKQAEKALEESEIRYHGLVDSMSSGVAVMEAVDDAKDFRFIDLNVSAQKILKVDRKDVLGRTMTSIFPALPGKQLMEAMARVWRTGRPEQLPELFYSDGRLELWATNSLHRMPSGDLALVFDDVTASKQAEEEKRAGQEMFRAVFEESPDSIGIFDAEGRLVDANAAALRFLGVPRVEDVSGLDLFSTPPLNPALKEKALSGETVHFQAPVDFDLARAMGAFNSSRTGIRYVDVTIAVLRNSSGGLQGYILHTSDETDRFIAELALRENEERFRLIFQQSPVGIEVYDREGRLVEMNPACLEIYGIQDARDMLGFDLLADPEMPEELKEQIRKGQSVRFETTVDFDDVRRDGVFKTNKTGLCHLDMTVNPLLRPDGTITGYLVHSNDITKRKTAEEAFRQGEIRYRTIFESSALGVFESTLEGKLLRANSALAKMFGFASQQDMISTVIDVNQLFVDPDRRSQVSQTVIDISGAHYFENDYRRHDGTTFVGNLVMQAVRDSTGSPLYFFGFIEDITEKKKAEEALRENEQRYRLVVQTQRELVCRWLPDTTLTFANNAYCRFHGGTPEQLVGKRWIEFMPQSEAPFLSAKYEELAREPRVFEIEHTQASSDGALHWFHWTDVPVFDDEGFLVEFQSVGWDITDRKLAEEARAQSDESFRSVVDLAADAIFLCDEMGRFIDVNPAGCGQLGYAREELLEKSLLDITAPEYVDRSRQRLSTPSQEAGVFESGLLRVDGSVLTVEIGSQKVMFRGKPTMLGVARDITERRRAEDERRKLEAQMQQTQKLECLGVLAGGIAHDFNNLLMVMLGHANLAARQMPALSPVKENVREIERAAQRAAELCRQMLAYSGKGRGMTQRVHLRDLIEEMANMLDVSISKKAVLRFDFAEGLPQVEADPSQLRQVVMNLILNASEAVGERSGVITISTGAAYCDRTTLSESWAGAELPEGLYVHVEVADTGCGMDPETMSKVFDPFFTTKFAGRGLGLAAVLGIVKGHKGAVLVKSESGKGTVFRVLLPPAAGAEPARKHAGSKPAKETALSGKILLADDEETVRALERSMLEALGCEVVIAQDGRDAVEVMRSQGVDIDCVLLDLTMPHMNGIEAVTELRRLGWDTPIVVCTGYDSAEVGQSFSGLDISGVVQKPFDLTTLGEAVRKALKTGKRR